MRRSSQLSYESDRALHQVRSDAAGESRRALWGAITRDEPARRHASRYPVGLGSEDAVRGRGEPNPLALASPTTNALGSLRAFSSS
jgi:hypothetical protein